MFMEALFPSRCSPMLLIYATTWENLKNICMNFFIGGPIANKGSYGDRNRVTCCLGLTYGGG